MNYCVLINDEEDGMTADVRIFGPFTTYDNARLFATKCQARANRKHGETHFVHVSVATLNKRRLRHAYTIIDDYA